MKGDSYPVKLPVRYKFVVSPARGRLDALVGVGAGETICMSSDSVRVRGDIDGLVDRQVQLEIEWPVLLDGATKLKLCLRGYISEQTKGEFGIRFHAHEYRTAKGPVSHGTDEGQRTGTDN